MGHYHETHEGIGKNRKDAEINMRHEFERKNNCQIRGVTDARFLRKQPPTKWVERKKQDYAWYSRVIQMDSVPDYDAPESEWLEVWEFDIHIQC